MCRTLSIVVLFVASVSRFASGDPWPTYLGNYDRNGSSEEKLSPQLKLQWTYKAPAKPIKAWEGPRTALIEGHEMRHRVDFDDALQVVMKDGRAFFGSSVDHHVYCVDAKSGQTVWKFYTEGPVRLAPSLHGDKVYFGSDDGHVYCLKGHDGEVVWQHRVGIRDERLLARGEMISRWPVRTGVLVDSGIAYFGAGVFPHETVYLVAANADTGEIIWKNDTISQQNAGRNDLSPQGYLLANEDLLFVPSGRSLPVGISRETGEIVFQEKHAWRTDAGGVVGGTKALLGDGQVYAGGPHHFLAMDQQTGLEGDSWIDGRQMALSGEQAFIATGTKIVSVDREVHADASQEKQKWFLKAREFRRVPEKKAEAQEKMEEFASVGVEWAYDAVYDDALIACENLVIAGGQNMVIALDRNSGKRVWQYDVEGNVRGLAISDGTLTVSTDAGQIYAFSAEENGGPQSWPEPLDKTPFEEDALTGFYRDAAKRILQQSKQHVGYCLVLGSEDGRLSYELAMQTKKMTIYGIEPDAAKARRSREAFERAGLHGVRVQIVNAPLDAIPFANYFANLVTSDSYLLDGELPVEAQRVSRHLKPCGGVAILAKPKQESSDERMQSWLAGFQWDGQVGEITGGNECMMFVRGKLDGAGEWNHQYGNIANTSFTPDKRIKDGLGVLWYGDPGPSAMINRHEAAAAPLSTNGRMFIQGTDKVMCYDAYNGTFLWERENPGAVRTGVFNNRETSNLAATDDTLFVAIHDECHAYDAATGEITHRFKIPESSDSVPRAWAYVAHDDGLLFGTSTIREELEEHLRRRGRTVKSKTDAVFAVDPKTGERLWTYRGDNILHTTIAVGPKHMYFIDSSLTPSERQRLYQQDKSDLKKLTGEEAKKAEEEMKAYDKRMCVAINKRTGEKLWERAVDVTDTTNVSAGGGSLTVMYADGYLVLCGANANGHYWRQFLSGEFDKRKLIVLDAEDGTQRWAKNANYMNRPAVIGKEIYAEPWAFDLATGEPKKRDHPLTGEESDWRFSRPGHHCGVITATPNMMFFRSGFIGYYDLYNDSGTRHFAGQRLGCWVNAIPGNGLVMIPEASAGCVCLFSIASTVVMEPKAESKSWGILSAVGPTTPVKRIGINFGAPGDRKDIRGKEWFGYPRPSSRERLEFVFDLKPQLAENGRWFSRNDESVTMEGTKDPWIYTSGVRGLERFEVPLLGEDDEARTYRVRLHFNGDSVANGSTVKVRFQRTIEKEIQFEATDDAAMMHEVTGLKVERNLSVEILDQPSVNAPTIAGIEVLAE